MIGLCPTETIHINVFVETTTTQKYYMKKNQKPFHESPIHIVNPGCELNDSAFACVRGCVPSLIERNMNTVRDRQTKSPLRHFAHRIYLGRKSPLVSFSFVSYPNKFKSRMYKLPIDSSSNQKSFFFFDLIIISSKTRSPHKSHETKNIQLINI